MERKSNTIPFSRKNFFKKTFGRWLRAIRGKQPTDWFVLQIEDSLE
jgi:hypothetical protein